MRVFVTGASGHIASAVIPELIRSGHDVVGLARSDMGASAVAALGASVRRGDLDDLDGIKQAAAEADGVIHLALFDSEQMRAGNMAAAVATQQAVLGAFGDVLAGTGKPLVTTSALGALGPLGRPSTEEDGGTRVESIGRSRHSISPRVVCAHRSCAYHRSPTAAWTVMDSPAPSSPPHRTPAPQATPATARTGGLRCTPSTPRTSTAWHLRRPRPAPGGTR